MKERSADYADNTDSSLGFRHCIRLLRLIPSKGGSLRHFSSFTCHDRSRITSATLTERRYRNRTSPYSRIAFPRYSGQLVRADINIPRAVAPDAAFLALLGYGVMSGRQGDTKSPSIIRGEGCDFHSLFVLYDESSIRERFRAGSVRPDCPRLSWAERNHSFDSRSRSGLCLPERKTCSHDQEEQNASDVSELHCLVY
jgi:hypothetical protein